MEGNSCSSWWKWDSATFNESASEIEYEWKVMKEEKRKNSNGDMDQCRSTFGTLSSDIIMQ